MNVRIWAHKKICGHLSCWVVQSAPQSSRDLLATRDDILNRRTNVNRSIFRCLVDTDDEVQTQHGLNSQKSMDLSIPNDIKF
jgi:hypothetical protein